MRAAKVNTELRQEQIIEAAMSLIVSAGLSGLSIAGIAARVGIVPSAIYRHYAGKEAVLDAVLEHLRLRMLGNVKAVRSETADALERLRLLLVRHIKMLVGTPALTPIIFGHFSLATNLERWSGLRGTVNSYLSEVAQIIEQGQVDGTICPEIAASTAAVMFIGLIFPAAMLHRLSGGDFDPMEQVKAAWPVFRRGLSAGCQGVAADSDLDFRQDLAKKDNCDAF